MRESPSAEKERDVFKGKERLRDTRKKAESRTDEVVKIWVAQNIAFIQHEENTFRAATCVCI